MVCRRAAREKIFFQTHLDKFIGELGRLCEFCRNAVNSYRKNDFFDPIPIGTKGVRHKRVVYDFNELEQIEVGLLQLFNNHIKWLLKLQRIGYWKVFNEQTS